MLRPVGARVCIKRIAQPRPVTSLIIPDTISERPSPFGIVLAIGTLKQGGLKIGDKVVVSDYAGAPCTFELEGEHLEAVIVPEHEVLMVISDDPEAPYPQRAYDEIVRYHGTAS